MGRSWNVMISWYRWNFHTWLEMDLTSKNVLLWDFKTETNETLISSVKGNFAWTHTYLNTAISKLTRRMFATRR